MDIYISIHVTGVFIGLIAALISDLFFMFSSKDRVLTKKEIRRLKISSKFVWLGLTIIVISGILIFSGDPAYYIVSAKFLLKMLIVLLLIINGVFFHKYHLKYLHDISGHKMNESKIFIKNSRLLYTSGAISLVSWGSALFLGYFRGINFNFYKGLSIYLTIVFIAIILSQIARHHFLRRKL